MTTTTPMLSLVTLPLTEIRLDGDTQPRATLDSVAVDDYMVAMQDGLKFPPVVVFYDGAEHWLADGFHRVKAASRAGLEEIACDIHQGTREDARWYSFSANKTNGLRRTNEDKQRAVKAALGHPKSAGLSDHQIAEHVGVAVSTVGDWRARLNPTIGNLQSTKRTGRDRRTINTAKIGRKRKEVLVESVAGTGPGRIEEAIRKVQDAVCAVRTLWRRPEIKTILDILEGLHQKAARRRLKTYVGERTA